MTIVHRRVDRGNVAWLLCLVVGLLGSFNGRARAQTFEDCLDSVAPSCTGTWVDYLDDLCECMNALDPDYKYTEGDCAFTADQITAALNRYAVQCGVDGTDPCGLDPHGCSRCIILRAALESDTNLTNVQKNRVLRRARCPGSFPPDDVEDDDYLPFPPPELPGIEIGDPVVPGRLRLPAIGLAIRNNPFGVPGDQAPGVAGVDVDRGAYEPVIVDLSFPATGFPWVVGRSYSSQQVQWDSMSGEWEHLDAEDYQGINWRQISQPRFVYVTATTGAIDRVVISLQNNVQLEFVQAGEDSPVFMSVGEQSGAVVYDSTAGTYTYWDQHGTQLVFLDNTVSPSTSRYQLWKMIDAAGNTAFVGVDGTKSSCASAGYTSDGFIQEVHDSSGRRYFYEYSSSAIGAIKRLQTVTAAVYESSAWVEVGRVEYDHYTSTDSGKGLAGDLRMVSVVIPTSATSSGSPVPVTRRTYYRYYTDIWDNDPFNPGYPHSLKFVLEPEGTRNFDFDGTDFFSAPDFDDQQMLPPLSSYAANYFEYESRVSSTSPIRRITKTFTSGDCGCSGSTGNGAYTFAYTNNYADAEDYESDAYAADWVTRTEITRPDGTVEYHYFDVQGLPLRQVTKATQNSTDYYFVREMVRGVNSGLVGAVLSPAGVASYNPSTHEVTLNASTGLAQEFTYISVEGGSFVIDTKVKQGTGTTDLTLVSTTEYNSSSYLPGGHADAKIRRPFVKHTWAYDTETTTAARAGVTTPTGAHKTTTTYTFWSGTSSSPLAITPKVITTELPKVAVDQHGAGDDVADPAVLSKVYLRTDGTAAFTQRPSYSDRDDPVLTYMLYENGQMTRQIVDPHEDQDALIDDDDETDFSLTLPSASVGIGIVTQYSYDRQGRPSRTTIYDGSDSERDTLLFYTKLEDHRMVTLSVPKVVGSPITSYMGPVGYTVSLHNGRTSASATLGLSGTGGTSTTDINDWISLTADDELAAVNGSVAAVSGLNTTIYDNAGGKAVQSRSYFDLTLTWPGVDGTDYDQSEFAYDGMGRLIKTTDPTDTVTETVFDKLGRVIARRVGTTTANSVRTVERMAYDGGGFGDIVAGGNSYLTKTQQIPFPVADTDTNPPVGSADSDGDPFNDTRITEMVYDFRGRTKLVKNPVAPHSVTKYDNRNRAVASAQYSATGGLDATTDPTTTATASGGATVRLALSTSAYDARGQMYQSLDYEIDQDDGTINQDGFSQDIVIRSWNWYNAAGQVLQTRGASFTKHAYDRLGRQTHSWQLAKSDDGVGAYLDYAEVLDTETDKTTVAGDEVLIESQTGYDPITGRVLVSATIERHHDDLIGSTGGAAGSLEANDDQDPATRLEFVAADLKGRIQISAMYYDDLLRPRKTAAFGTHGGTDFDYTDYISTNEPSASSATVLLTTREYDKFGRASKSYDPKENLSETVYDDAGRPTKVLANADQMSGDDRTRTVYEYEDGLQKAMWVDVNFNDTFDSGTDQKTTYTYGVTTADSPGPSAINANNILRQVAYPPQMTGTNTVLSAYNALGEGIFTQDQAGNVTQTNYDTGGREAHRRATTIISGFDTRVQRVSTTYDVRGMVASLSQYDNPTVGSGSVVDQVQYEYDDAGMLNKIHTDADSAVSGSGLASRTVDFDYEHSGLAASGGGHDAYRLSEIVYPDGSTTIGYTYPSASDAVYNAAGLVGEIKLDSNPLASYRYNGAGTLIEQRQLGVGLYAAQKGMVSSLDGWETANYRSYAYLDRFDRITRSFWRMDTGNPSTGLNDTTWVYDAAYYDLKIETPGSPATSGYDHNSNIVSVVDPRWSTFSYSYTVDRLDRLADATVIGASYPREDFTLDRLGNFNQMVFDANSNGTLTDTSDLQDCRTHTQSNEISARNLDCASTAERSPVYNAVGELVLDDTLASGNGYKYTWDVFGRLTKIETNAGTPVTVAEFTYDARNHRTAWRHAQAGGGGDVPLAQWFYPVYDHRWRMIAVERQLTEGEGGETGETEWYEFFYYHNAGRDGDGGSSYIDAVIRRDRDANFDDEDGFEEARYYAQNWRGDVAALVRADGLADERYRYSAYGRPFNIQAGDFNATGGVSIQDYFDFSTEYYTPTEYGDFNFTGNLSSDDINAMLTEYFDGANTTTGWDVLSRSDRGNRKGHTGYEGLASPLMASGSLDVPPGMWLVRYRWHRSANGAWISRDPLREFAGDPTFFSYVSGRPLTWVDPTGLCSECPQARLQPTVRPAPSYTCGRPRGPTRGPRRHDRHDRNKKPLESPFVPDDEIWRQWWPHDSPVPKTLRPPGPFREPTFESPIPPKCSPFPKPELVLPLPLAPPNPQTPTFPGPMPFRIWDKEGDPYDPYGRKYKNQTCPNWLLFLLEKLKDQICFGSKCHKDMDCPQLLYQMNKNQWCLAYRQHITTVCFKGSQVDPGHERQWDDAGIRFGDCADIWVKKGCTWQQWPLPPNPPEVPSSSIPQPNSAAATH